MKTKINTEKLEKFLQGSDGFTKHLIQEGIKSLLLEGEEKTSITMKSYLEDLGLITIEPIITLFDKNKNSKITLEDFCGTKKCQWESEWDYSGLKNNENFFGTQKDWNQTLISRINEISSLIHQHSVNGGGNTLIISNDISYIIDDLEYFHSENYREFKDYTYFGKLGNRYDIISLHSSDLEKEIIVCRKEINLQNNSTINNDFYGKIKIINVNSYFKPILLANSEIQPILNNSKVTKKDKVKFYGTQFTCESNETKSGLIEKQIFIGKNFDINNFDSARSLEMIAKSPIIYDGKVLFDIGSKICYFSDLIKYSDGERNITELNCLKIVLDVRPEGTYGTNFKPELLSEAFTVIPQYYI